MSDDAPEVNSTEPRRDAPSFKCPHCHAFTQQAWSELFSVRGDEGDDFELLHDTPLRSSGRNSPVWDQRPTWAASECFVCARSAVWRGDVIIFPAISSIAPAHADLSGPALELYDEARAVAPHSRRAAAALARASLEALVKDLGDNDDGGSLDDRIARLQSRVSQPLWQLLTVVRYVGNRALHGGDTDELVALILDGEDADVIEVLFGAINGLVDELITRPASAEAMYAQIPKTIREAAEAKAARSAEGEASPSA